MTAHFKKYYKLRNIDKWDEMEHRQPKIRKIYNIKLKIIAFIINFGGNKTIRNR